MGRVNEPAEAERDRRYATTLAKGLQVLQAIEIILRDGAGLAPSSLKSLRVMLCQRFLTEQLDFTKIAKEVVKVSDFAELLERSADLRADRAVRPCRALGCVDKMGCAIAVERAEHPVGFDHRAQPRHPPPC